MLDDSGINSKNKIVVWSDARSLCDRSGDQERRRISRGVKTRVRFSRTHKRTNQVGIRASIQLCARVPRTQ